MSKRRSKSDPDFISMKQWKESPPGPEQLELERMLRNNLINSAKTPDSVRQMNSMFMEFSPKIFATHFRKTKAKFGLYAATSNTDAIENDIPELGKGVRSSSNYKTQEECLVANAEFDNPPVLTWKYTDHEMKCDFVNVAIPIFSGCTDINFSLSEDGMKVSINFSWPSAIFNAKKFFEDELKDRYMRPPPISLTHPKIHSMTSQLLERGITENSTPRGSITIPLPLAVQREVGSWTKKAIKKDDGTRMVFLQFKGYQQNIVIDDADTSITFN